MRCTCRYARKTRFARTNRLIGESTNRLILRVSESRSNAVTEPVDVLLTDREKVPSIDYAEREQNHEGEA